MRFEDSAVWTLSGESQGKNYAVSLHLSTWSPFRTTADE
jgi:hypothetical protein